MTNSSQQLVTMQIMSDESLSRHLADPTRDADPVETAEWCDALLSLIAAAGPERARFVLGQLAIIGRTPQVCWSPELVTPYTNTIAADRQPRFPGDLAVEERLAAIMR